MPRKIKYKENKFIEPCPKCSNNTSFMVYSKQFAEDCCEIWADCECGYSPASIDYRYKVEDIWGGVDDNNCMDAICYSWNEPIRDFITTGIIPKSTNE